MAAEGAPRRERFAFPLVVEGRTEDFRGAAPAAGAAGRVAGSCMYAGRQSPGIGKALRVAIGEVFRALNEAPEVPFKVFIFFAFAFCLVVFRAFIFRKAQENAELVVFEVFFRRSHGDIRSGTTTATSRPPPRKATVADFRAREASRPILGDC